MNAYRKNYRLLWIAYKNQYRFSRNLVPNYKAIQSNFHVRRQFLMQSLVIALTTATQPIQPTSHCFLISFVYLQSTSIDDECNRWQVPLTWSTSLTATHSALRHSILVHFTSTSFDHYCSPLIVTLVTATQPQPTTATADNSTPLHLFSWRHVNSLVTFSGRLLRLTSLVTATQSHYGQLPNVLQFLFHFFRENVWINSEKNGKLKTHKKNKNTILKTQILLL